MKLVVIDAAQERIYGPFENYTEASIWRDKNIRYAMIVNILSPDEYEK